jgi:hypothetical protein
MALIDTVKAFLAANPAAKVWVEEALFRGKPGDGPGGWGEVAGSHFTLGFEMTGPTGQVIRRVEGPFSAAMVPPEAAQGQEGGGATMAEVLGLTQIMQLATIDALNAALAEQAKTIATLQAEVARLTPADAPTE